MVDVKQLKVKFNGSIVGYLKEVEPHKIIFQYDSSWIKNGFSISPFSLPLNDKQYISNSYDFDGLFGVFYESLPDGWGKHLLKIALFKKGIDYNKLSILTKLSLLPNDSLGGLNYEPTLFTESKSKTNDLDKLYKECLSIVDNKYTYHNIDDVLKLGSGSGGSRPKIHTKINGIDYIVKFKGHYDPIDIGLNEYNANVTASSCKINTNKFKLLKSKICKGYFAAKRFDRDGNKRIHVISLAAILEQSLRYCNLDYINFFQVINAISINKKQDLIEAYKRLCFNVFYGNKDDHGKNFLFSYDEKAKGYILAPAFDLTKTPDKIEHEMTANNNGNPTEKDLLDIGKQFNIYQYKKILNDIKEIINKGK